MQIEKANINDLEAVCYLDRLIMGNENRRKVLEAAIERNECLIAREADIAVGYATCEVSFFGYSYISLVIVHPEYRRLGVASQLMTSFENCSLTEKLFTSTNESNKAMQQVCEALGYTRSGIIENLDEGDPELIYFKKVKAHS